MLKEAKVACLKVVTQQAPTDNEEYNNTLSKYLALSQDSEQ
jgi:hypothetical protein